MERVGVRTDAGLVDFRAIEFRYPKFLLGPLTLKIDPGAAVALVGPNGAGKTTRGSFPSRPRAAHDSRCAGLPCQTSVRSRNSPFHRRFEPARPTEDTP